MLALFRAARKDGAGRWSGADLDSLDEADREAVVPAPQLSLVSAAPWTCLQLYYMYACEADA